MLKSKRKSENTSRQVKMETQLSKINGLYQKTSYKGEVYSNIGLPQETRKYQVNNLSHLKELENKNIKPKGSKMKGIIKIRKEINKIDHKIENINET